MILISHTVSSFFFWKRKYQIQLVKLGKTLKRNHSLKNKYIFLVYFLVEVGTECIVRNFCQLRLFMNLYKED
uniref:Uncharacterized protein n=1 Tax=Anguilla anguilla TaxID=7936 RepID=A0A0E9XES9_ANGAN